jgi:hypothetical protein
MGNKNTITIYKKKEPCKRTKLATEGEKKDEKKTRENDS